MIITKKHITIINKHIYTTYDISPPQIKDENENETINKKYFQPLGGDCGTTTFGTKSKSR